MSKEGRTGHKSRAMHITGALPSGLTKKVASSLEERIRDVFQHSGADVRVRGMRFIPSTRVDLGEGTFEVLASTVVEIAGTGETPMRPEAFDAVVTVGREAQAGQILKGVKIPALERVDA